MEPLAWATVGGAAASLWIHHNYKHLSDIPRELRSLSDECSRLEIVLRGICKIEQEPEHQGLASSSRPDCSAIIPIVDSALVDGHTRLSELQSFIKYISKKAQEDKEGDHWQWIRKRNNIDRLRAELRSIRYDLTVHYGNASSECSSEGGFMLLYKGPNAIQSTPRYGETFGLHRVKADDLRASSEVWSQLFQEYQQEEWMSAYSQRPRVQGIQASDNPESETSPQCRNRHRPGPDFCRHLELIHFFSDAYAAAFVHVISLLLLGCFQSLVA